MVVLLYNGFTDALGSLEAQRKAVLDAISNAQQLQAQLKASLAAVGATMASPETQQLQTSLAETSSWKPGIESAFHCVAGTTSSVMSDSAFYHFCFHAGIAASFPEDTDEVAQVNRVKRGDRLQPELCRGIFTFVTQGAATMNVSAFFHALVHCEFALSLSQQPSLDPANAVAGAAGAAETSAPASPLPSSPTNNASSPKRGVVVHAASISTRLKGIYAEKVQPYVARHSTSYPFPEHYYREVLCVARTLWKFSEGLEHVYDRYVRPGGSMSLGEYETCFTEFGVIPQVSLPVMHRLFFAAASAGSQRRSSIAATQQMQQQHQNVSLTFDQFLEVVARIACEVLSDDTFSRWLTLEAKTAHFLSSMFGSAYANIFQRPLPREEGEPPHPYVAGCNMQTIPADTGATVRIRGRYFGAIGRGVWMYDSASDAVQRLPTLLSDEEFDAHIRPNVTLEWTSAEIIRLHASGDSSSGGGAAAAAFSVRLSCPIHVAVANAPEDLPFFSPLVAVTTAVLDFGTVTISTAAGMRLQSAFLEGCHRSSSYNTKHLYEINWKFVVEKYKLTCGAVNLRALGMGSSSIDEGSSGDPGSPTPSPGQLSAPHAALFSMFATRRKSDTGGRPSLSFDAFVECVLRITLSRGTPTEHISDEIEAAFTMDTTSLTKSTVAAADGESGADRTTADTKSPVDGGESTADPPFSPIAAPPLPHPQQQSSSSQHSAALSAVRFLAAADSARRQSNRDDALLRNMAMERRQSVALKQSNTAAKQRLAALQKELERWDSVHGEVKQGLLQIKSFCDLLFGTDGGPSSFAAQMDALGASQAAAASPASSPSARGHHSHQANSAAFTSKAQVRLASVYRSQLVGVCDRAFAALDAATMPAEASATGRNGSLSESAVGSDDDAVDGGASSASPRRKTSGGDAASPMVPTITTTLRPVLDLGALQTQIVQVLRESQAQAAQLASTSTRKGNGNGAGGGGDDGRGGGGGGASGKLDLVEQLSRVEESEKRFKAETARLEAELDALKRSRAGDIADANRAAEEAEAARQAAERALAAANTTLKERDKLLQKTKQQLDATTRKARATEDALEARKQHEEAILKELRNVRQQLFEQQHLRHHGSMSSAASNRRGSLGSVGGESPQGAQSSSSSPQPGGAAAALSEKERLYKQKAEAFERRAAEETTRCKELEEEAAGHRAQHERDVVEKEYLRAERANVERLLQTVERWASVGNGDMEFLRTALSAYRKEGALPPAPPQQPNAGTSTNYKQVGPLGDEAAASSTRQMRRRRAAHNGDRPAARSHSFRSSGTEASDGALSEFEAVASVAVGDDIDDIAEISVMSTASRRAGAAASAASRLTRSSGVGGGGGGSNRGSSSVSRKKSVAKGLISSTSGNASHAKRAASSSSSSRRANRESSGDAESRCTSSASVATLSGDAGSFFEVDDAMTQTEPVVVLAPSVAAGATASSSSSSNCGKCSRMRLKLRGINAGIAKAQYSASTVRDELELLRHHCRRVMSDGQKGVHQLVASLQEVLVGLDVQPLELRRSSMLSSGRSTPPPQVLSPRIPSLGAGPEGVGAVATPVLSGITTPLETSSMVPQGDDHPHAPVSIGSSGVSVQQQTSPVDVPFFSTAVDARTFRAQSVQVSGVPTPIAPTPNPDIIVEPPPPRAPPTATATKATQTVEQSPPQLSKVQAVERAVALQRGKLAKAPPPVATESVVSSSATARSHQQQQQHQQRQPAPLRDVLVGEAISAATIQVPPDPVIEPTSGTAASALAEAQRHHQPRRYAPMSLEALREHGQAELQQQSAALAARRGDSLRIARDVELSGLTEAELTAKLLEQGQPTDVSSGAVSGNNTNSMPPVSSRVVGGGALVNIAENPELAWLSSPTVSPAHRAAAKQKRAPPGAPPQVVANNPTFPSAERGTPVAGAPTAFVSLDGKQRGFVPPPSSSPPPLQQHQLPNDRFAVSGTTVASDDAQLSGIGPRARAAAEAVEAVFARYATAVSGDPDTLVAQGTRLGDAEVTQAGAAAGGAGASARSPLILTQPTPPSITSKHGETNQLALEGSGAAGAKVAQVAARPSPQSAVERRAQIAAEVSIGLQHMLGHNTIPGDTDVHRIDATDRVNFLQERVLYRDDISGKVVSVPRDEWEIAHAAEAFLCSPRNGPHASGSSHAHNAFALVPSTLRAPASRGDELVEVPAGRAHTARAVTQSHTAAHDASPLDQMAALIAHAGPTAPMRSGRCLFDAKPLPATLQPRLPSAPSSGPNAHLPPPSRLLHSAGGGSGRSALHNAPIVRPPKEIDTRRIKAKRRVLAGLGAEGAGGDEDRVDANFAADNALGASASPRRVSQFGGPVVAVPLSLAKQRAPSAASSVDSHSDERIFDALRR